MDKSKPVLVCGTYTIMCMVKVIYRQLLRLIDEKGDHVEVEWQTVVPERLENTYLRIINRQAKKYNIQLLEISRKKPTMLQRIYAAITKLRIDALTDKWIILKIRARAPSFKCVKQALSFYVDAYGLLMESARKWEKRRRASAQAQQASVALPQQKQA